MLDVPCLTLRENTERPITCDIGTNVLVGTDPDRIRAAIVDAFDTDLIKIARGEPTTLDFALQPEPEEPKAPPVTTGRVIGRVVNAADQMPVPFAIITFNGAGLTPVASDELEGKYATYQMPAGTVKLDDLATHKEGHLNPTAFREYWEFDVEKVAVNAVMAGCRPEYFPVVLAMASSGVSARSSSTTSFQPRLAR